jgi:ribonuclease P protein component
MLAAHGRPGSNYVFIARGGATTRPWDRLLDDVKSALIRLAADPDPASPQTAATPSPSRTG